MTHLSSSNKQLRRATQNRLSHFHILHFIQAIKIVLKQNVAFCWKVARTWMRACEDWSGFAVELQHTFMQLNDVYTSHHGMQVKPIETQNNNNKMANVAFNGLPTNIHIGRYVINLYISQFECNFMYMYVCVCFLQMCKFWRRKLFCSSICSNNF